MKSNEFAPVASGLLQSVVDATSPWRPDTQLDLPYPSSTPPSKPRLFALYYTAITWQRNIILLVQLQNGKFLDHMSLQMALPNQIAEKLRKKYRSSMRHLLLLAC
ncbi:hypothetical protein AC579_3060 [Pseudocercospora musae]|uniref:Uncharacterized protein n=1 Tax=Pseudocercospora musae TaxID=113226 RepID=A0A139IJL5_9PEZI|nr:hypothetical protein AC579_3060 [Pseudocercospora musae]